MQINLNDASTYPRAVAAGQAQVWTKARWADAFVLRPDLIPVQSVWTMAPDVSTATLEYRYGRILVPGSGQYSTLAPITARGWWVLIRWQADNGSPIDWLGYAEQPVTRDHYPARDSLPQTGKQTIPCYGLVQALRQSYVDTTVYVDPDDNTKARRSAGTGSVFNDARQLRGNRSKEKLAIGGDGPEAYVFAHPNDDEAKWWSTRDIIEHLTTFHLPTPASVSSSGGVPWQVTNLHLLPTWDRPTIESDLRSLADLIAQLLDPSIMLGWGVGFVAASSDIPSISSVTIRPFSLLAEPLPLPSGIMPANESPFSIAWQSDPLTVVTIDEDASGVVDQVIVQGPREITVCTLQADPIWQSTHEKAWLTIDEDAYSDGARLSPGFDTETIDEQRVRNERVRTSGKLRDVYSLYRFKQEWDGRSSGEFLFMPVTQEGSAPQAYLPSPIAMEFLDELPLYAEVNYVGDPKNINESAGMTFRKPFLALRRTNEDGDLTDDLIYVDPEGRLSLPEDFLKARPYRLEYSIDDRCNVRLIVKDAPQHAIAGKSFVGNVGDLDQETMFGDIRHTGWQLTVAIRGDRRPRFAIPSPEAVQNLDVVRRKIVTLDDESLAHVYIAKNTVVGWANNQATSTKSPGGVLRDPTPILRSICTVLARQHTQPRRRATITTARRLPQLQLGMMARMIETARGPVDAIISELRIDAPISEGQPAATRQTIVCSPYRADVLDLLRRPAGNSQPKRRQGPREIIPRDQRRAMMRQQRGKR